MAKDKNLVRVICYEFSADALFVNLGDLDLNGYKVNESTEKYASLCKNALQQMYVEANVEVIPSVISTNDEEVYVESLIDFEQIPDLAEEEAIKEICDRVFQEQQWVIPKNFIAINEVKSRSQMPLAAIRWFCANE